MHKIEGQREGDGEEAGLGGACAVEGQSESC